MKTQEIEARLRKQFEDSLEDEINKLIEQEREAVMQDDVMQDWEERRTEELTEAIPGQIDNEREALMSVWAENRWEELEQELTDRFEEQLEEMIERESEHA